LRCAHNAANSGSAKRKKKLLGETLCKLCVSLITYLLAPELTADKRKRMILPFSDTRGRA
jgi:hypothetical protein